MRKNAKATGGADVGGDGASNASAAANSDDSALVAEIEEDAKTLDQDPFESRSIEASDSNRSRPSIVQIGPKRRQLGLFWDLGHGLLADLPGGISTSGGSCTFTDVNSLTKYDSREHATCQRETLRRLRHADLLTLSMSQAEYMEYSECRQASFTYKKARKFREWLIGGTARPASLGLATLAGGSARDLARLSDDTLEILGFLAYEIVQKLTEVSLAVKYELESSRNQSSSTNPANTTTTAIAPVSLLGGIFNNQTAPNSSITATTAASVTSPSSLSAVKTPIQVQHVEEAYRKLISVNMDGDSLFRHSLNRKRKFIL